MTSSGRRIIAALACGLVATPALARAPKAVLVRTAGGGGSPGKTAAAVILVDAATTEIVSAARPAHRGPTRLHPAAGVYMAIATAVRQSDQRVAVSLPFRFDGSAVKLKLQLATESPDARLGLRSGRGRDAAATIATLGRITLGSGSQIVSLAGPLARAVFDAGAGRVRLVESGAAFLQTRQLALERQGTGQGGGTPPIVGSALDAAVRVDGELQVESRRVHGTLHLIDPATQLDLGDTLIDEAFGSMEKLLRTLADRIVAALVPVVTTTSTTSSSTTSTDVAGSTTTVATSSTTTLPISYCQTSADCGPYGCCGQAFPAGSDVPVGVCCTWGRGCPLPVADGVWGASSLVCSASDVFGPPPPQPLDPGTCGPSTPTDCPDGALNEVSFTCTTCGDTGKYVGYLFTAEQILEAYP